LDGCITHTIGPIDGIAHGIGLYGHTIAIGGIHTTGGITTGTTIPTIIPNTTGIHYSGTKR